MGGEVINLPVRAGPEALHVRHRLEGVAAIFAAIDAGELLAAYPDCEVAQEQHKTALLLLAVARRELKDILSSLND